MHEEHAGQLHQAQAHHTRRVHLRWTGFLDTAGITDSSKEYILYAGGHLRWAGFLDTAGIKFNRQVFEWTGHNGLSADIFSEDRVSISTEYM